MCFQMVVFNSKLHRGTAWTPWQWNNKSEISVWNKQTNVPPCQQVGATLPTDAGVWCMYTIYPSNPAILTIQFKIFYSDSILQ